jgi:hypothetical protein
MNVSCYLQKDYENEPHLAAPGKQTQSKPILKQNTEVGSQETEYGANHGKDTVSISPKSCTWGNYSFNSLTFCQSSSVNSLIPEPVTAEMA